MKKLRRPDSPGKEEEQFRRVDYLRKLLGHDVLMLAWPAEKKGTKKKWKDFTIEKMEDSAYLRELEAGNIGVALGTKSNGLCSIDFDDDESMKQFFAVNPKLHGSLRTRADRGCNVWVRIIGKCPRSFHLKNGEGKSVGEWRANGNQTIVSGKHPTGCDYSFVVAAKPAEIAFESIVWPEHFQVPERKEAELPIEHRYTGTQEPRNPDTQETQAVSLPGNGALFDVSPFLPKERGQTDHLLWRMAGRMKTFEKQSGRIATTEEKTAHFKSWWALAKVHVDPEMDFHACLAKWQRNCKQRRHADGETALLAAWNAAKSQPLPPAATVEFDGEPLSEPMRLLIGLCYHLQVGQVANPFYLSSRDAARLLGINNHTTVFYWLERLSDESNPHRVLQKVSTGSQATRRANEYLYLPLVK